MFHQLWAETKTNQDQEFNRRASTFESDRYLRKYCILAPPMTATANGRLEGGQISVTEARSLCDVVDREPLNVGEKWSVHFSY